MNKSINNLIGKVALLPAPRLLLLFLYFSPILGIIWFVNYLGVNIPSWDQWEFASFFQKVASGEAGFQDFFALHNEHRIFFPKLIITFLAFTSGWNITYEFYVSILATTITYFFLIKIAASQEKAKGVGFYLANIFTGVMLFSFIQWESWLFGLGMVWFLINTFLVLCIFFLYSAQPSVWAATVAAAICCIVASFSLANGLLIWLTVLPLLFYLPLKPKQIKKVISGWLLLFLLSCIAYFTNYHKPTYHPDSLFFLSHPLVAADYFFTLLGSPLLYRSNLTITCGFLIFLNYIIFIFRYIKNPLSTFSRTAIPWLSLGLFSVLSCLITTVGRAGFGVEQANSPRYTTFSLLLLIALVQLWRSHINSISVRPRARTQSRLTLRSLSIPTIFPFVVGFLTILVIITSVNAVTVAKKAQSNLLYGRECLKLAAYVGPSLNNCLSLLYFDGDLVKERAKTLEQIGFWQSVKAPTFVENPDTIYGYLDPLPNANQSEIVRRTCINCVDLELAGWAILPGKKALPHLVLLSYGDGTGTIFANANINRRSPDIAKTYRSNRYYRVRWSVKISPKLLPLGNTTVKAWVYDSVTNQIVKLKGDLKVTVGE